MNLILNSETDRAAAEESSLELLPEALGCDSRNNLDAVLAALASDLPPRAAASPGRPHPSRSAIRSLLLWSYCYASGPLRRWYRRRAAAAGRMPIAIVMYHRIADDRANAWTTSTAIFQRQITWLQRHVEIVSLEEAQRRLRNGVNYHPCACITFDDGYAENCRMALPLLLRRGIPCTYFVTLHHLLSGEPFLHDRQRGNRFAPNSLAQLRTLAAAGVEIGSHCYHHANLAEVHDAEKMHREVVTAGQELARLVGHPVRYLAFPFGRHENLSPAAIRLAYEAGCQGVCSAFGGYNLPGDDWFHLQRINGDDEMSRFCNWLTIDPRKLHQPRFAWQ